MKGKTWGPSSVYQREKAVDTLRHNKTFTPTTATAISKSPVISDTTNGTIADKTNNNLVVTNVGALLESNSDLALDDDAYTGPSSKYHHPKRYKEMLLNNMGAMLASIALGRDYRTWQQQYQNQAPVANRGRDRAPAAGQRRQRGRVLEANNRNSIFDVDYEFSTNSGYHHNTYHGAPQHHRPPLGLVMAPPQQPPPSPRPGPPRVGQHTYSRQSSRDSCGGTGGPDDYLRHQRRGSSTGRGTGSGSNSSTAVSTPNTDMSSSGYDEMQRERDRESPTFQRSGSGRGSGRGVATTTVYEHDDGGRSPAFKRMGSGRRSGRSTSSTDHTHTLYEEEEEGEEEAPRFMRQPKLSNTPQYQVPHAGRYPVPLSSTPRYPTSPPRYTQPPPYIPPQPQVHPNPLPQTQHHYITLRVQQSPVFQRAGSGRYSPARPAADGPVTSSPFHHHGSGRGRPNTASHVTSPLHDPRDRSPFVRRGSGRESSGSYHRRGSNQSSDGEPPGYVRQPGSRKSSLESTGDIYFNRRDSGRMNVPSHRRTQSNTSESSELADQLSPMDYGAAGHHIPQARVAPYNFGHSNMPVPLSPRLGARGVQQEYSYHPGNSSSAGHGAVDYNMYRADLPHHPTHPSHPQHHRPVIERPRTLNIAKVSVKPERDYHQHPNKGVGGVSAVSSHGGDMTSPLLGSTDSSLSDVDAEPEG